MIDAASLRIFAAMTLLAAFIFTVSYLAATTLRLPINLPRWALLLLGSLLFTTWSFSAVFDVARDWGQDPQSWHYAWIHPTWLHFALVLGGSLAGCVLGGIRARGRGARTTGHSQPAA